MSLQKEERTKQEKRIILDMTLIEGHMKVLIDVDDQGKVTDVKVQGIDSRYFEKFCEGFPIDELPKITPRICGLCSASHHIASARAIDVVYGAEVPKRAELIRRGVVYGIILNNHALHLVMMGLPDVLLDEKNKSMMKLMRKDHELVKLGTELTSYGHEAVKLFGGRDIHPVRAVAGGVAKPPSEEEVKEFIQKTKEAEEKFEKFEKKAKKYLREVEPKLLQYPNGAEYHAAFMQGDKVDYYGGKFVLFDSKGNIAKEVDPQRYEEAIKEYVVPWSYIKPVTVAWKEYPEGSIRSGPVSRVNMTSGYETPVAQALLQEFRERYGRFNWHPLLAHEARIIEIAHTLELIKGILESPELFEGDYLVDVDSMKNERGVGAIEAPRGVLFHDVRAKQDNSIVKVAKFNIITPTALNAAAMEADLRAYLVGKDVKEMGDYGLYSAVTNVIRSYDPCMACATHSVNKLGGFLIEIRNRGKVIKRIKV